MFRVFSFHGNQFSPILNGSFENNLEQVENTAICTAQCFYCR